MIDSQNRMNRSAQAVIADKCEYVGNHEGLVSCDGSIRSGLGIHLTPTKKKRKVKGKEVTQLKQGFCKVCKRKTKYTCSKCEELQENEEKETFICHPSTNRDCFFQHIQQVHERTDTMI